MIRRIRRSLSGLESAAVRALSGHSKWRRLCIRLTVLLLLVSVAVIPATAAAPGGMRHAPAEAMAARHKVGKAAEQVLFQRTERRLPSPDGQPPRKVREFRIIHPLGGGRHMEVHSVHVVER